MILILVFSKDRALQLDACLTSFARHVTDGDSVRMVVLYAASSPRFLRQYQELAREHSLRAEFVLEQDLRAQVLRAMKEASLHISAPGDRTLVSRVLRRRSTVEHSAPECMLFLVDDALFVKSFRLGAAKEALLAYPDALGFSLRLGRNTTESYVLNRAQTLPPFQTAGPGNLKFDWTKADGDFGYPLEISSSVYRVSTMISLLGTARFSDPNTLESQLTLRSKRFVRSHPYLLCSEVSVAFSAPLNRVQEVYTNRSGESLEWTAGRLADRFDEGYRLDIGALDGFVPAACHQEVELSFRKQKSPNAGR